MRLDTAESMRTWSVASAGLAPAAAETMGKQNLIGFQRIRGTIFQNVAGTPIINMYSLGTDATPTCQFTVTQDTAQPNFRYTWDVIVIHPYVEIIFTNGGAPSTIFRAQNMALPT